MFSLLSKPNVSFDFQIVAQQARAQIIKYQNEFSNDFEPNIFSIDLVFNYCSIQYQHINYEQHVQQAKHWQTVVKY